MQVRFHLVAAIVLFGVAARAGDIHPSPNQWNLTDYLKGTPEQIRRILYKDIIRLDRSIRDTEHAIEEAKLELAKDTADSLDRCHKRPDYVAAKAERDSAARDLIAARNGGQTEDRVRASSRFNRAKAITDRLEGEAISGNPHIHVDQQQLATNIGRLSDQQKSLSDAIAWKDHLLAAGANSLKLVWPVDPGATGFLGTVKVDEVDGDKILVGYEVFEPTEQSDAGEGLVIRKGIVHPVKLLITCPESHDCHQGSRLLLNRTFEVVAEKEIGDVNCFIVRSSPSDADKLWQVLTAPITDSELSAAETSSK